MKYMDYEVTEHVALMTFNRPERLNAAGQQMFADLSEALLRFEADGEARVAILTGKGRAFCAGADLKELGERGAIKHPHRRRDWFGFAKVSKPVIAAINGFAYGGGFFNAIFCDIRIAAESATFSIAEINRGRFGSVHVIPQQGIPYCILMELGLGEVLTARRACQAGLVNFVVPDGDLLPAAQAMARRIAGLSL
ncbi:MAG: enoyl-CoA hydratase/isomerase family protein, partial [Pseudomonadota bacterium]